MTKTCVNCRWEPKWEDLDAGKKGKCKLFKGCVYDFDGKIHGIETEMHTLNKRFFELKDCANREDKPAK